MEEYKGLYEGKIGVLLTNLGTPNAPTKKALKKYLNQFLMDKRVVDINRLLWIPLLKLIILNVRPKKSAKLYKKIWTNDGSPLMMHMNKIKNQIVQRGVINFILKLPCDTGTHHSKKRSTNLKIIILQRFLFYHCTRKQLPQPLQAR